MADTLVKCGRAVMQPGDRILINTPASTLHGRWAKVVLGPLPGGRGMTKVRLEERFPWLPDNEVWLERGDFVDESLAELVEVR